MEDDPPISPVDPVHADAVDAVDDARPPRPARATPPPDGRTAPYERATLAPGIAHEQLEHPISTPRGVDRTAGIHDSAAHGDPIAAAIERAHTADPTDRAQQLGGAAASAASGQSARIELTGAGDAAAGEGAGVDPFAPVESVTDERRGDTDTDRPGG